VKTFLLIAILVALTGCQPESPVTRASNGRSYTLIEVDGCEYLEFEGYHERAVTHKGNCSNPNHCK